MRRRQLSQLLQESQRAISAIDIASVEAFVAELVAVRRSGGWVFIAGNGGSASTASHMAIDLMLGSNLKNPPLRVLALADNACIVTGTGNDVGFEDTFARQIEVLGSLGDLLVVVSASGSSPNILKAVSAARNRGIRTVALTGFDGGAVAPGVDVHVHIPTARGAYGPVEDAHLAINHIVTSYLREHVAHA